MAFAQIANIMPQYEDLAGYWLKAYQQGTAVPLSMATDATGMTLLVKSPLDSQGFPLTSLSGARFIPFIDGNYDLYLYPTKEEADANITVNAIQVADNINADAVSGVSINAYKQTDTVTTLVADTSLALGDFIETTGYVSIADGGAARYETVAQGTATADGVIYIDLPNTFPPLQAKLTLINNLMHVRMSGAGTDGIPSLRMLPGIVNSYVDMQYHTTKGDKSDRYYWDETSTATDDDDLVIKVASVSTGRWLKISGTASALFFGGQPVMLATTANRVELLNSGNGVPPDFEFTNSVEGGTTRFRSRLPTALGSAEQDAIVIDSQAETLVQILHNDLVVFQTADALNGGGTLDNQLTGNGPERILTDSDTRHIFGKVVYKTSNQSATSTTFINDTELFYPILANEKMHFKFKLLVSTSATDIGIRMTFPTGGSLNWSPVNGMYVTTSNVITWTNNIFGTPSLTFAADATSRIISIEGNINNGGTAGTVQLQFNTNTSTIRSGSYMMVAFE